MANRSSVTHFEQILIRRTLGFKVPEYYKEDPGVKINSTNSVFMLYLNTSMKQIRGKMNEKF